MAAHERKRFAEKVTYISSPGYLEGGEARSRFGFPGGGPSAIITTLGILRPDPISKEFELSAWFPFSSVEEIKANTGWDLKVAANAHVMAEPTEAELAALRQVDETGALRKN
jgi:glutaconate CoA-transferase, subunit B